MAVMLFAGTLSAQEGTIYETGVSEQLAAKRKENIKELKYELSFVLPEQKSEPVQGTVNISFTLEAPQEVVLDFREQESVKDVLMNGVQVPYRISKEHIILPQEAGRNGQNSISISFVAGNQSLNRNDDYLYTLLVPDRARTLFPCFDQPDMKASFKLTLDVPQGWSAVSNSPVENEEKNDSRNRIVFSPTEPLSTYLFSFVAGRFSKEVYDDGKHTFAAYHRETDPKRIAQLPVIFSQVALSLEWLEEYTGVPYPFAKYDFVILPGFQYGGMEHTGATLYNDSQLFLSENPTPDEELRRAELIAHETAHMWFGDLVTMQWFNDVWTKEVFANYFAARIAEPMFPDINHRLSWLKNIVTPALSEDRTAGGTAIRQPLDNMRNAGLIYNNIIYDKAPVMLEKLVAIMGEESFREGIHDYLEEHAYGNATWDDLIEILDGLCDADLGAFSDVWVNRRGMPHLVFEVAGDTLAVRQNDPYGRGLLWRQCFNVTLVGEESNCVEVEIKDTVTHVELAHPVEYILPNSDGRGYGYFIYDAASLGKVLNNWHTIEDDVCRQAQLMNLHEAYQHGRLSAEEWLASLAGGIGKEDNALVASTVCSYLHDPLRETADAETEQQLLQLAGNHPLQSCRTQLLRVLVSAATSPAVCSELYDIWAAGEHPLLSENDYMNMAYELSLRFPDKHEEIIARQRRRIENPDRLRQFDFVSRAVTPDTAKQEELFYTLLQADNRRVEPWALKTLGYLCHPLRADYSVRYIRPALDALQEIQRTSDIFFPQSWVRTLLGGQRSKAAYDALSEFLSDNPGYPQLLKNKILKAAWPLQRAMQRRD